ncbi:MAG: hypothetical protein ANABAC_1435 [Anaerolineae bacterium]|nr:MAG: hypothetical protein ANABAC_1435 [Anaerolineae bacterium]
MPWRQVIGHHAPLCLRAHDVAQPIEDFAQRILSLRGFFGHESKVGRNKRPLIVRNITRVGFECHTSILPFLDLKFITHSSHRRYYLYNLSLIREI